MTVPFAPFIARAGALVAVLAGVSACAPTASVPSQAAAQPGGSPILLSCPAGQQPLLRQVPVNGALVPQVECVTAGGISPPGAGLQGPLQGPPVAPGVGAPQAYVAVPQSLVAPTTFVPAVAPVATAPMAAQDRGGYTSAPPARRVVYDDDVVEYRPAKKSRSVKKSLLIIGSSAGVGAGVGAATGGKKGALIGAAIGGGAATVWDQMTRR